MGRIGLGDFDVYYEVEERFDPFLFARSIETSLPPCEKKHSSHF